MGTVYSGPGEHLVLPAFNPAFFVASISDTLTKAAAQPPWNFRPPGSCSLQTQVAIPRQWDSPHALSAPGTPDSMSDAQALQFRTGRRGASHAGVAPAKVLADSLHASLHSAISPQQHVLSMIQHHLLPALILAQQRVAERLRSLRPKRNRGDKDSQNHDACAYVYSGHGPRPSRVAQKLYESARSLERGLDPLGAAEAYELAVQADPRQSEWFSLIAKNMSDATFLSGVNSSTAQQYNQRAIEFANQALALAPDAAHPYISRCVSRGRLALFVDNRTKVHLARDASEDAAKALAIEPNNDWAHHLMGRFHFEMAGLNAIARTLVRILFGTALMEGSYQEALKHYRMATQISPTTLVHRAELGRTLVKLGKHQEALTELQEALLLDVEDINAHLTKIETAKLVKTLMNSPQGRLAFLNVPIQPPAPASVKIEEVK